MSLIDGTVSYEEFRACAWRHRALNQDVFEKMNVDQGRRDAALRRMREIRAGLGCTDPELVDRLVNRMFTDVSFDDLEALAGRLAKGDEEDYDADTSTKYTSNFIFCVSRVAGIIDAVLQLDISNDRLRLFGDVAESRVRERDMDVSGLEWASPARKEDS